MKTTSLRALYVVLASIAFAAPARAVDYVVTLLHPAGVDTSYAMDVSGTSQVGFALHDKPNEFQHAFYWNGTAASAVDLNPTGFIGSTGMAATSTTQVGSGSLNGDTHALLWHGTAASAVDLHPAQLGFSDSDANDIAGPYQVGQGRASFGYHALLWSGTAASAVDLNPPGYTGSAANGISESGQVVGYANGPSISDHAMLWNGTAESAVDLHPAALGVFRSIAWKVSGSSQVGIGELPMPFDRNHALLWHGTAESAIDLTPAGYYASEAHDVAGEIQVGNGYIRNRNGTNQPQHALLWNGTPESFFDLHPYVAALNPAFVASTAQAISEDGAIVGWAYSTDGHSYAVLWTPVPEPASILLASFGLFAGQLARRRRV